MTEVYLEEWKEVTCSNCNLECTHRVFVMENGREIIDTDSCPNRKGN